MDISFEQQAYEIPDIWEPGFLGPDDEVRVAILAGYLARKKSTDSILDVGCGNGLFLNHILDAYPWGFQRLTGVDRSQQAIKFVRTEKFLGSIDALPFSDSEFHTVTCLEVLEHLTLPIYPKAISEIARVARSNILVSVPYDQNLRASLSECPYCLAHVNPDYHLRSFNEENLRDLLSHHGFRQVEVMYISQQEIRWDQIIRSWVKSGFRSNPLQPWPSFTVCPACGYTDTARPPDRKPGDFKSSPLASFLRAVIPKRSKPRWIVAYYERAQ